MTLNENDVRKIAREEINNSLKDNINYNNNNIKQKKKKREPSKWNLYLKDCSKDLPKDMAMGEKAKSCSNEYKKVKDNLIIGKDGLENVK